MRSTFSPHKGFTLIELLVVISIIGLIATLSAVALKNARVKGRDSRRLADMKQLHSAMELCLNANGGSYITPTECCTLAIGNNNVFQCTNGLVTSMPNIAKLKDPSGVVVGDDCDTGDSDPCEYTVITPIATNAYTIKFYLEGASAGYHTLTQIGIQ
ncbi:MAG: type II secretion system protein [Patescibacteria group bacterium]